MEPYLETLNPKQREAVLLTEGPLLIVAGAGTGKTKTLTHRIYHLIHQGVHPRSILAITFTNKAAKEMRERVFAMLEKDRGSRNADLDYSRKHQTGYEHSAAPAAQSSQLSVTGSDASAHSQQKGSFTESENFAPQEPREDEVAEVFSRTHQFRAELPTLCTFHSLGVRILRRFYREANLKKTFVILDSQDTMKLIKDAMEFHGINPKVHEPKKIRSFISSKKSDGITAEGFSKATHSSFTEIVSAVWTKYEQLKSAESGVDFDDLLLKTLELLEKNLEVRKILQNEWLYIHIDEYQDTNRVQYDIVRLLAEKFHNLCVVGDTDQNIYSWRGANLRNILNFEKDYPESQVILLEENYRSTKNILIAADEVIKKNTARIHKDLRTKQGSGEKLALFTALNEGDEARHIAKQCAALIRLGVPATEIAVLYRTNFQSRILEESFLRANVPYQLLGTKFFERREIKDVVAYIRSAFNRDGLSDIKRIINEPKRGLGPAAVAKVFSGMENELSALQKQNYFRFVSLLDSIVKFSEDHAPSELVRFVIEKSGFFDLYKNGSEEDHERLENLEELVTFAVRYDTIENETENKNTDEQSTAESLQDRAARTSGLSGHDGRPEGHSAASDLAKIPRREDGAVALFEESRFEFGKDSEELSRKEEAAEVPSSLAKMLEDIALQSDQDQIDDANKKSGVKLMTIHSAKGLEFDHVFIGGLEQGLFPHDGFDEKKSIEDQEEERRLFYVALTRARKQLHLSHALMRTIYGEQTFNEASEFLADIPNEIILREENTAMGNDFLPVKTVYLDW